MILISLLAAHADTNDLPDLGERLDRHEVVALVVQRHPSLAAGRADAEVARWGEPAARALPGPAVEVMFGPGSIGSHHPPAVAFAVEQPLPPPGMFRRAQNMATADAEMRDADVQMRAQELARRAVELVNGVWRADRGMELLDAQQALVDELAAGARARYVAGEGMLPDTLEAELERVEIDDRRLMLTAERAVMLAELRGLLDAPDAHLPPPSDPPALTASVDGERPERIAAAAAVREAEAGERMARVANVPEPMLLGSYASMFDIAAHRWMVGAGVRVPVDLRARAARVHAASAGVDRARAAERAVLVGLTTEQQVADAMLAEADARVTLLVERRIPLAQERLSAVRDLYAAGSVRFGELLDAARALTDARQAEVDALANRDVRRAEVDLSRGRLPGGAP